MNRKSQMPSLSGENQWQQLQKTNHLCSIHLALKHHCCQPLVWRPPHGFCTFLPNFGAHHQKPELHGSQGAVSCDRSFSAIPGQQKWKTSSHHSEIYIRAILKSWALPHLPGRLGFKRGAKALSQASSIIWPRLKLSLASWQQKAYQAEGQGENLSAKIFNPLKIIDTCVQTTCWLKMILSYSL